MADEGCAKPRAEARIILKCGVKLGALLQAFALMPFLPLIIASVNMILVLQIESPVYRNVQSY
jgi:hypothetical protein